MGQTRGRFAACVATQEVTVRGFGVGAWAGKSSAGGMALPPAAALRPGFSVLGNGSLLAQASPGSIPKALRLTAVP